MPLLWQSQWWAKGVIFYHETIINPYINTRKGIWTRIYIHTNTYIFIISMSTYISYIHQINIISTYAVADLQWMGAQAPLPKLFSPPPKVWWLHVEMNARTHKPHKATKPRAPKPPNILLQPFLGIAKEPIYEYDVCVSTPLCSDVCYHFDVFYHFDMTEHVRPTPCFF